MGTIVIGVYKSILEPGTCLVNKLTGLLGEFEGPCPKEMRGKVQDQYLYKRGYTKFSYGHYKGRFVFVAGEPASFFYALSEFKITVHLSQWDNLKEVYEFFVFAFGAYNATAIFNKARVLRCDFWLDLELTMKKLNESVYRPKVSVIESYKSLSKSTYFGSRNSSHIILYEKKSVPREKLDLRLKRSKGLKATCRIESRKIRHDVPFKTLSEYIQTADLDVFGNLRTLYIPSKKITELKSSYPELREYFCTLKQEGLLT